MKIPFESEKFKLGFRPIQGKVIETILNSDKKVVVANLPTGTGKSLIGMVAGHYKNGNLSNACKNNQTLYVCTSKMLQEQLHDDFPEAVLLKGRANYTCNLYPLNSADTCDTKCEDYTRGEIACDYEDKKKEALKSKYTILNTSYYLNEANNVGRFSHRNSVIIDEADVFEDSLIDFISLELTDRVISKYSLSTPDKVTKLDAWKSWGEKALIRLAQYRYIGLDEEIRKEKIRVGRLAKKIRLLIDNIDETWLFEHKNKFSFKPLWLTRSILDSYLYHHANQFILMSATMMPKVILQSLFGLQSNEIDYIESDCPFPIENRQVEYLGVKRLKYGESEDEIYKEIERIINVHKHERGIIHAVSYSRAEQISKISKRMITHNSNDKLDKLRQFYSTSNAIFVSPSSERGLDLKDDLARFCIIPKIPYASLSDEMTKRRSYSGIFGNRWYKSLAAQSIVQMVGRGVRHENDYCRSYILDSALVDIVDYTPQYFKNSILCRI